MVNTSQDRTHRVDTVEAGTNSAPVSTTLPLSMMPYIEKSKRLWNCSL